MVVSTKQKAGYAAAAVTAATVAAALPMAVTKVLYDQVFSKRVEAKPEAIAVKYSDFRGLERQAVAFASDQGQSLRGYFYYPQGKSLAAHGCLACVVLSHGIFQGHQDYLYDVDRFVKAGFLVFGFDNTGCVESGGKKLLGLDQAVIDLHYALLHIENCSLLSDLPLLLYGHSMGGFAVTAVLNYGHRIAGVVSRSGFYHPLDVIRETGIQMYGGIAALIMPFVRVYRRLLFKGRKLYDGIEGIKKAGVPVLVMHSRDDNMVCFRNSLYKRCQELEEAGLVHCYLCDGKGHDIVRQDSAVSYMAEIEQARNRLIRKYGSEKKIPQQELQRFYEQIDTGRWNVHDEAVMERILDFMKECTGSRNGEEYQVYRAV